MSNDERATPGGAASSSSSIFSRDDIARAQEIDDLLDLAAELEIEAEAHDVLRQTAPAAVARLLRRAVHTLRRSAETERGHLAIIAFYRNLVDGPPGT